ncbi:MAG TPA: YggS family pyridoxal phosphate-dependent enzyme [Bacteroidales bacterium]|nr:YggS family pyridoxal phosphate-dependent enzyme [Bacteroidales bacterium]HPT01691.1 YggS family pyridoxal phosphate-dependent enzyme [Bacteroidales bacterium]
MQLVSNYENLYKALGGKVRMVAVSKTKPVEMIRELYDAGQRDFGENRVQELTAKSAVLPADITWHFIGHLQTNKVRFIVPFVGYIHSVDSLKLLSEINREAAKINRVINCLLQFHIATEETKFGLSFEEAAALLNNPDTARMQNVRICGIMGMATFTDNKQLIRNEFRQLKSHFDKLKTSHFNDDPAFREISMGMSNDYEIAIEEGSTMVRIGSLIFGER